MAQPTPQETGLQDDLLDKFIGHWRIERFHAGKNSVSDAVVTWELDHCYVRIVMVDTAVPSQYSAHVYIGYERNPGRYVIHWMDVTSGSSPAVLGFGRKQGDSIVCEWKDPEWTLLNTFTYNAADDTWTSKIEQAGSDGKWSTFCVDTFHRAYRE